MEIQLNNVWFVVHWNDHLLSECLYTTKAEAQLACDEANAKTGEKTGTISKLYSVIDYDDHCSNMIYANY